GDDGHYVVRGVQPGEYSLFARHPAYLSQGLGQTAPATPERRVVVTAGAQAGPLHFSLVRGAAIAGRVVDDLGEPAQRVQVRAAKLRRFASEWRLIPFGESVETNDLGEYRLHGLPPGEYVVSAEPPQRPFWTSPESAVTAAEPDLVQTWAPGTHSPADAQRVRLEPGGEGRADLQLVVATVATIAGRALDSRGIPVNDGSVRLQARGGVGGLSAGNVSLNPDGTFGFPGAAPGAYTLVVQPRRSNVSDVHTGEPPPTELGVLDVEVNGEPLTNLVVRTAPGATIRGRLVVDGDAAALGGLVVYVLATPTESQAPVQGSTRARVSPDLSFEMRGVRGRVQLRLVGVPEGWWTRAVRQGGTDATDAVEIGSASVIAGVELVVSTKPTALRGTVTHTSGTPADAVVLLFTRDEPRWEQSVNAAGTMLVRTGEDGHFRSPRVRPGRYYVVALGATEVKSDDFGDPEYLRALAPRATRIDVAEGQIPDVALIVP
nr:carboxypeptidase regulatory-like domain-containing protein [Acidobacteriota bacterium]